MHAPAPAKRRASTHALPSEGGEFRGSVPTRIRRELNAVRLLIGANIEDPSLDAAQLKDAIKVRPLHALNMEMIVWLFPALT